MSDIVLAGEEWSAIDACVHRVFWRVAGAECPIADYPRFAARVRRPAARSSFDRAMAIEAAAMLEAEGLVQRPPPPER